MIRFLVAAILVTTPALAADTLYTDATLIDGAPRPHTDILVRDERIVAVGPRGSLSADGARMVDLSGKFVIPGMIDSHVHLATPPDRPKALAELRRHVYGGVTGVRDMADDLRAIAELARESEAGEIAAPDIAFAALMAGPDFFADPRVLAVTKGWKPGTAPWMQSIDDRTDLRLAVARAKGTGAAAIKIYADLPARLIKAITAEAHRQGMLIWTHSAIFPTRPADVIAAGPDSVSHACYLAYQADPSMPPAYEDRTPVHEEHLAASGDDPVMARIFAEMKKRGVLLDATGAIFERAEQERAKNPKLRPMRCTGGLTARLIGQAYRAGLTISAGTDFGVDGAWPALDDELVFLVEKAGLPPAEALRAATINGAKAMGLEKDMGSVEPGKLADFVVLARDPLADIANVRSVETTVKRGREYPRADYKPGDEPK